MKLKTLLFSLSLLISLSVNAQKVQSSCTAPDSIANKYKNDAHILARLRMQEPGSGYSDTARTPAELTDSMLRCLLAVYNAETLTERDTVTDLLQIHARPLGSAGDGPSITIDTISPDYISLQYEFAWGPDCISGCTHHTRWYFRIYYDCSVEFAGREGDLFTNLKPIKTINVNIGPNPFNDVISISNISSSFEYVLYSPDGRILLSGQSNEPVVKTPGTLPAGFYFLKISTDEGLAVVKLIKE